ncbi:Crp/Fnr family transcriptional regulator [Castellaniella sp.]|uniref:Crp/Fnr family transcriptional regulator n=1 Tax=Castellaniella sp. TaxID=1955812 RepID=UPI0035661BBD
MLVQIPYFQGIPPDLLAPLIEGAHRSRARRGEIIALRGEPCDGMHIVVSGRIKLYHETASGLERIMRIIEPGDSFGEALMFMEHHYIITAEALDPSELLYLGRDLVIQQMEQNPALARHLVASLSRHLYMMMGDFGAYTVRSGRQRLIAYLLRESGGLEDVPMRLPMAKGVIASRLNLTPQHFSRILHDLGERGLILIRGREFTILDADGLRAYYEQQAL